MAVWSIPAPGAPGGPCSDGPCGHRGCHQTHALADTTCGLDCGERIGFGARYLQDPTHGLVHRTCWLNQYESRPDAYGTAVAEREAARL